MGEEPWQNRRVHGRNSEGTQTEKATQRIKKNKNKKKKRRKEEEEEDGHRCECYSITSDLSDANSSGIVLRSHEWTKDCNTECDESVISNKQHARCTSGQRQVRHGHDNMKDTMFMSTPCQRHSGLLFHNSTPPGSVCGGEINILFEFRHFERKQRVSMATRSGVCTLMMYFLTFGKYYYHVTQLSWYPVKWRAILLVLKHVCYRSFHRSKEGLALWESTS